MSRRSALAAGIALALSGCGSSSSSSSPSTAASTPATPTAAATTPPARTYTYTKSTPTSRTTTTTYSVSSTSVATAPPPVPAATPTAPDGLAQTTGYSTYELCSSHCTGAVPAVLRRKLHIPQLAHGARCVPGAGTGPVTPSVTGTMPVTPFIGSHWDAGRITWTAPASFTGPILIRGRALQSPHAVGFGEGRVPYDELQLYAAPGVSHRWGSFTRVRGPGCYAYQVDTAGSSAVVSFRAVR